MTSGLKKITGFTLIEIAIVLIVLTIILGYTIAMVPVQQEIKQYRKANEEMDRILDALYAYAQVNGRLPCADNMASPDGVADPDDGTNCTQWYGYVPSKTLGLEGDLNSQFSIPDPWGTPYIYQVTPSDANGDGDGDFVKSDGGGSIRDVGMGTLAPDLVVCTTNPTVATEDTGCSPSTTIVDGVPAVILTLGKDRGRITSNIQDENTDNPFDFDGDLNEEDRVFVKSTLSDASGSEFDDVVKWIVPNVLYSKMIDANKLP